VSVSLLLRLARELDQVSLIANVPHLWFLTHFYL
jgi:hypothetical protein